MNLRSLGDTGLLVSPLGLGLAALGRPGYINLGHAEDLNGNYAPALMEIRAHQMLDLAFEAGIRYVDAARSYGRAEQFLSTWLESRHISADELTVGSKWGYAYTAAWQIEAEHHEIKEHSLERLQQQWGQSQEYLGAYLKLYQIHSATFQSGVLENREILTELARLKKTGLKIGLSLSGAKQTEVLYKALDIRIDGMLLFDCVQATWNLLEPSATEALREARATGMGVIIKEALANGRLTNRNQEPEFADKLAQLREMSERLNTTVDALALAAVLAQPWVDVVLSGAARREHLLSNLSALHLSLDEAAFDELNNFAETPESYWQTRKKLAWN